MIHSRLKTEKKILRDTYNIKFNTPLDVCNSDHLRISVSVKNVALLITTGF